MWLLLMLSVLVFTGVVLQLYVVCLETENGDHVGSGSEFWHCNRTHNVTLNKKFPLLPYLKDCDHPFVVSSPFTQTWSVGCGRELVVFYTQDPSTYKLGFVFGLEYFYTLERNGLVIGAAQVFRSHDRLSGCFRFHPQPSNEVTYS